MTLSEMRELFVEVTGRKDLEDTSNTISANWYIQRGSKYLDKNFPSPFSKAWIKKDLDEDEYSIELNYCRAVFQIYATDTDNVRYLITKKSLRWWKENYDPDGTSGNPEYWAQAVTRLAPEQFDLTAGDYTDEFTYDTDDHLFGDSFEKSLLLFSPMADETYTISILGRFDSTPLTEDTDSNFWSNEYPDALVFAAALTMERMYRNREGASAWLDAIQDELKGMEDDIAENESITEDIYE